MAWFLIYILLSKFPFVDQHTYLDAAISNQPLETSGYLARTSWPLESVAHCHHLGIHVWIITSSAAVSLEPIHSQGSHIGGGQRGCMIFVFTLV